MTPEIKTQVDRVAVADAEVAARFAAWKDNPPYWDIGHFDIETGDELSGFVVTRRYLSDEECSRLRELYAIISAPFGPRLNLRAVNFDAMMTVDGRDVDARDCDPFDDDDASWGEQDDMGNLAAALAHTGDASPWDHTCA